MHTDRYRRLLVGRETTVAGRYLLVATVAGAAVFASYPLWRLAGTTGPFPLTGTALLYTLLGASGGLAGTHAYRNEGLLVGVVVAALPWLGRSLSVVLLELAWPRPTVVGAVGMALLAGAPIGAAGYVVGRAYRHLGRRLDLVPVDG